MAKVEFRLPSNNKPFQKALRETILAHLLFVRMSQSDEPIGPAPGA